MKSRKCIIKAVICILWLTFIFYNGTRPGEQSQRVSGGIVNIIQETVYKNNDGGSKTKRFRKLNYFVRKNAHFFEYLIFGVLFSSFLLEFRFNKITLIFILLFFILLFPVIDEFIQSFIQQRTSSVKDVIIDFSGGVIGGAGFIIMMSLKKESSVRTNI